MRNDSKISPIPPLKNRVHEFSRMTVVQGAWGPALREKGDLHSSLLRRLTGSSLLLHSPCGETLYRDDEVSPPGETALATAVSILGSERLEPSHPRPAMTGPTKTEDRRGMILMSAE